jgi:hypothetical protein
MGNLNSETLRPAAAIAAAGDPRPKTPLRRPIQEIIKDLSKKIEPRHLKSKKLKGNEITFIPWYIAVKYLDHYAPGWSNEVRSVSHVGGKIVLVVRVTIPAAEGDFFREATGQEDDDVDGYGDPASNAESMALRRAAAKFGLGLYLYNK